MNRRLTLLIFSLLLIFSFSFTAFAHPGDTDELGGHIDRSTGQYHYHHGKPEHLHTGGVCPYNTAINTNYQSSTSSNSSTVNVNFILICIGIACAAILIYVYFKNLIKERKVAESKIINTVNKQTQNQSYDIAVRIEQMTQAFLNQEYLQEDIKDYIDYTTSFHAENYPTGQDAYNSLHACILSINVFFAVSYPTRNYTLADNVLKFLQTKEYSNFNKTIENVYNTCANATNSVIQKGESYSPAEILSTVLLYNHITEMSDLHIEILQFMIKCLSALSMAYPHLYAEYVNTI